MTKYKYYYLHRKIHKLFRLDVEKWSCSWLVNGVWRRREGVYCAGVGLLVPENEITEEELTLILLNGGKRV